MCLNDFSSWVMPNPRKGSWQYGYGSRKGSGKKGYNKGGGRRPVPLPIFPGMPPASVVPPRPKMRPQTSGSPAAAQLGQWMHAYVWFPHQSLSTFGGVVEDDASEVPWLIIINVL